MSYLAQDQLANHPDFQARVRACSVQQAQSFVNDQRPTWVALAHAILRGDPGPTLAMFQAAAASPGLADEADNGEGGVDPERISDPAILATVQAIWPTVAGSFYNEDGSPKP